MLSDALRKRLQELNRAALNKRRSTENLSPRDRISIPSRRRTPATPTRLEDISNGSVETTSAGCFWLIEREASQFISRADELIDRYSYYFESGGAQVAEETTHPDLLRFVNSAPRKSVFLDIETTGLSGSPLFLVGLLLYREHDFVARQLFARDYSEEKPLLRYLFDLLEEFETVVTFNGKTFDLPYIRDRASYNMLPALLDIHHLDLLHECRRRWKSVLPNCRLQTLESRICYRYRTADIPGSEIPKAYHDFVRTADAWQIKDILHHNALDLITMSELVLRLFSSNP